MIDIHSFIGLAAGILAFSANPLYIRGILRGQTKPNRVTWWILALASLILAASYFASGARDTVWVPIAYFFSFTIIAILSLRYGEGDGTLTLLDKTCVLGAIISIFLWWFTGSPVVALFFEMGVELFGLIPTIAKAYRNPVTEDFAAWAIAVSASLLNVFAITDWSYVIATYPIYIFVTNAIVFTPLALKRLTPKGI